MGGGQFFLATTNSKHIGIEKSKDKIKNELEAIKNNPPLRWRVIVQNDS